MKSATRSLLTVASCAPFRVGSSHFLIEGVIVLDHGIYFFNDLIEGFCSAANNMKHLNQASHWLAFASPATGLRILSTQLSKEFFALSTCFKYSVICEATLDEADQGGLATAIGKPG